MRHLLLLACLTAPAFADPTPTKTPDVRQMHTDDCARARKQNKTCVLDMGTETVEGKGSIPTGSEITTVPTTKQPSLIHIRHDFIVEILKSAEDL